MIRNITIFIFSLPHEIKSLLENDMGIFNKFKNLIIILILFGTQIVIGQDSIEPLNEFSEIKRFGRYRYIDVKGHYGRHLYAGQTLGDVLDTYGSFELRYGWQPSDPDNWTNQYGYFSYGIGYYIGFIGDPEIIGTPNALFGFINIPLSDSGRRNVFQISPALGVAFNLEPYDPITNPDNDTVGGSFATYISLGFGAEYKISNKWDMLYGIDYTHFSIARLYTPNYGFNMYGLNLGFRYLYNADQIKLNKDPNNTVIVPARFRRLKKVKNTKLNENSIEIFGGFGTVQNIEDKGTSTRYFTFSGVIDYKFKLNNAHGFTGGFDVFYDESLAPQYPENIDRVLTGIHLGYDFMISKLAIRLQGGLYLSDDKGKEPTYMRVALQYEITKWFFVQLGLKSKKGARADWLEYGIGFKPFRW
jgi:hypothetical protein